MTFDRRAVEQTARYLSASAAASLLRIVSRSPSPIAREDADELEAARLAQPCAESSGFMPTQLGRLVAEELQPALTPAR